MYDNLYCKVYLNTELEIEELYQYINGIVLGKFESIRTIKTSWGDIDLRRNSDFDFRRLKDNPEDFVFWQYYLDIEPMDGINELSYIGYISKLLDGLSSLNIKSVASCDFEQDL